MGTFASIIVPAEDSSLLPGLADEARMTLENLESRFSVYRTDSDISRINAAAGEHPVPVAPETAQLLEKCAFYSRKSDGAFDATIGPALALWRESSRKSTMPSPGEIRAAAALVDYRLLAVEGNAAMLQKKGMSADLGGIAKGFAVDVCLNRLQESGVRNVMVDLGGNMRCLGSPDGSRQWLIGVRHPFDRSRIIGRLSLASGAAVATSGNYERFVEIQGRKFGHILDPRSGLPADEMASVTVTARSACEADALSTAIFVLGMERGARLLQQFRECGAILVPNREPVEVWMTADLQGAFAPEKEYSSSVRLLDTRPGL